MTNGIFSPLSSLFFEYSTLKVLVIRSKSVGTIFRLIQALILGYVIGYVCIIKKVYQDTDSVISSVTTKVKGNALTNTTDVGVRVWDVADYVIPPQEANSFFVLTNMIITLNQTQAHCPESPSPSTICTTDSDCTAGFNDVRSNGIQTGQCVNYSDTSKTCEVLAWCPLEIEMDMPTPAVLAEAKEFTVLIKNSIKFPKFGFSKRNILPNINSSYLKSCIFNRTTDPECPIFRLKDIVEEANEDFQTIAVHGGVIGIQINWDCDLDKSASRCVPRYAFQRIDNKSPDNNVSPGYNFRFAKYYKDSKGMETRTLVKASGIRFDIIVFGKAGKFSIVPTVINVGAALVILKLANLFCDWVMLSILTKKALYRKEKTTTLDELEENVSELSQTTKYGTQ